MNPPANQIIERLRQQIAEGELPAVLQQLPKLLDKSPKLDEALHQSGRLSELQRQIRMGTVSYDNATFTRNQIQAGVLDLLDNIKALQSESPVIMEELQKAGTTINNQGGKIDVLITGSTLNNPVFNIK